MASFDLAIEKTLKHEGGYVNDPKDPGGETNFGISKRSYPNEDIKGLTKARAKEIYKRDFWSKVSGDKIKSQNAADSVFDMAVNAGPGKALELAKKALAGIGGFTLETLPEGSGDAFARGFGGLRIQFYRNLVARRPQMAKFLKGWEKRANSFFTPKKIGGAVLAIGSIGLVWWLYKKNKQKIGA